MKNRLCTMVGSVLAVVAAAQVDGAPTLVGHWTFENGAGNQLSDTTGNGHTGTLQNGPAWVTDNSGPAGRIAPGGAGALQFDGSNDFVLIPNAPDLNFGTKDFSLNLWFKTSTPVDESWHALWTKHNSSAWHDLEYWVAVADRTGPNANRAYGALGHRPSDGYAESLYGNSVVTDGAWHMTTLVRRQGSLELWVDGVLNSSRSTMLNVDNSNPVNLARSWYGGGYGYFPGLMDEVSLYSGALSGAEIVSLYTPEPGASVLLGIGMLGLMRRRPRRR